MNHPQGSGSGPAEADRDATWTNETLPLGIRRELLDRELQNLVRKKHAEASRSSGPGGGGQHPVADGPAPDDRAS
jgi:hypothetical protein